MIRDAEEKRHKRGVNALQLDHNNGRMFSCGKLQASDSSSRMFIKNAILSNQDVMQ